ncbi:putative non-specific serine/threonine protein kinase [Helianthus anomalus]
MTLISDYMCLGKWFSKGTGGSRFTGFFHPALVLQRLSWSDLLARASSKNDGNSFRSLLEAQNADGQTALHLACRRGSAELVEAILSYPEVNVDVLDKDGDPPLELLLAGADPNAIDDEGESVLHRAVTKKVYKMCSCYIRTWGL